MSSEIRMASSPVERSPSTPRTWASMPEKAVAVMSLKMARRLSASRKEPLTNDTPRTMDSSMRNSRPLVAAILRRTSLEIIVRPQAPSERM